MKISKKMPFFLMAQGSLNPKIRFLAKKNCDQQLAYSDTDRQTYRHESDYCGHPFRVSGVFPSTQHQGSGQLPQPSSSCLTSGSPQVFSLKTRLSVVKIKALGCQQPDPKIYFYACTCLSFKFIFLIYTLHCDQMMDQNKK